MFLSKVNELFNISMLCVFNVPLINLTGKLDIFVRKFSALSSNSSRTSVSKRDRLLFRLIELFINKSVWCNIFLESGDTKLGVYAGLAKLNKLLVVLNDHEFVLRFNLFDGLYLKIVFNAI